LSVLLSRFQIVTVVEGYNSGGSIPVNRADNTLAPQERQRAQLVRRYCLRILKLLANATNESNQ
jgi:hypothetical protein